MKPSAASAGDDQLSHVEELLDRLTNLRRHPRYRQLLAEGTGFEGRITPMRILRAIDALSRSGSMPSIREVAQRLGMEHSNTSRAVDQVVERGLVDRRQSDSDARRTELWLTPRGLQAIQELHGRRLIVHQQMLESWDEREVDQMIGLLKKLCRSYEDLER